MNKQNKLIVALTVLIILVLIIDFLLIFYSEKKKHNTVKNKLETKEIYKCSRKQQDLQFALLDIYYHFEFKNENIRNQKQEYVFKFANERYYNQFGKMELFTEGNIDVEETKDEENLRKHYTKMIGNSKTIDDTKLELFVQKLENMGYYCKKE